MHQKKKKYRNVNHDQNKNGSTSAKWELAPHFLEQKTFQAWYQNLWASHWDHGT